jgi:hypothetical protein
MQSNVVATKTHKKQVGDPCAAYESMRDVWGRARAILSGQQQTKDYDKVVNPSANILLPFSPFMDLAQYNFYKAEAELPGLVSQYAKVLVGGLLRKNPEYNIPAGVPAEAKEWLESSMGGKGKPMVSLLDEALWEEMVTSRSILVVDFPKTTPEEYDALTPEQRREMSPYAVAHRADSMINWRLGTNDSGAVVPTRVVFRFYEESFADNEFHPDLEDVCLDYFMAGGKAFVQKWGRDTNETADVNAGAISPSATQAADWRVIVEPSEILINGENLGFLPIYPLNGNWHLTDPALQPLVDRETALYNKVSRRNHLLYGAATYTPYIASDISDDQFQKIVNAGLGSWIHLQKGETLGALETPTDALKDMEASIKGTVEEMARMGIRMLSPEGSSGESGVSLEIRNAAQTAQLGLLNVKVSQTLQNVVALMLRWKYDIELDATDLDFTLSQDFNPTPLGADWMRLVTEWYQSGVIPRSVFLTIAKQNDVIPSDYDDKKGVSEIQSDVLIDLVPSTIDVESAGSKSAAAPKNKPTRKDDK